MRTLSQQEVKLFISYLDFEIERLRKEKKLYTCEDISEDGLMLCKTEIAQLEVVKDRFLLLLDNGEKSFHDWFASRRKRVLSHNFQDTTSHTINFSKM
jgi:hypothetical protein